MHSLGIEEDAVSKIFLTHADADHAGAAGYFKARSYMHPGTMEILLRANRAYGSKIEGSILEEVYTRLINLFSRFNPPAVGEYLYPDAKGREGAFDVIGELTVGRLRFKVLNGLGGHLHGQIYFLCEREGLLFTGDSLINFASFTPERERYNSLAKILMTTVNVDSDAAREERIGLMRIAKEMDAEQRRRGKRCLVCGGHGALSVLDGEKLVPFGEPVRLTGAH
jgi:glyoxylase-like metal-dependent hydrolase (beta-lactamase superfamily II)